MRVNDVMNGFVVTRVTSIQELNAQMYELEHQKTHLHLAWLKRDEENKTFGIAFKTLPNDDTGVFHILEHSVLCGSKKYPVKEPFVELMKNSMNTFLNALTFPDKTFYPISSKNDKDFMNLTKVYLDAVFQPLIYDKKEIFLQEGWHYELGEKPQYKGVVFNEMKGAFSSPYTIMNNEIMRLLFKDNCYQYVSGGDPKSIPSLTYEDYLAHHQKYYSPTNAYVFLDGNVCIDEVLELLDKDYLCNREATELIEGPTYQQPCLSQSTVEYEVSQDDQRDNLYRLSFGRVIGTFEEQEKLIAMQVLADVLCGNNQAPLNQLILSQGLAEDVYLSIDDGIYQNYCQLAVDNLCERDIDKVRDLIFDELKRIVKDGVDKKKIEASLANFELNLRERNYGSYPQGIIFGFQVLESWLYGGHPESHLEYGPLFESLRKKMNEGYFESLIQEVLIDNKHACEVILKPSRTLGQTRRLEEEKRLQETLSSLNQQQLNSLKEEQASLNAFQNSEDTIENLQKLPQLSLEDINTEPEKLPTEVIKKEEITLLKHTTDTNGIHYYSFYFPISHLNEKEISALSFVCRLLGQVSTDLYQAEEIPSSIRLLCGNMQFYVTTFEKVEGGYDAYLCASISTLPQKEKEAISLLLEILTHSHFNEESLIQDILKQNLTNLKQSISSNGHSVSLRRVFAQVQVSSRVDDCVSGIAYYQWLKEKEKEMNFENLCKELESVYDSTISSISLTMSFTGKDDRHLNQIIDFVKSSLSRKEKRPVYNLLPLGKRKEGILVPTDVSYASLGGCASQTCKSYALASRIISLAYLWNVIRVQGGAYGTGMVSRQLGLMSCYSYRDPHGIESLKQYMNCGQFLRDYLKEKPDLSGYIIGTISALTPLIMPYHLGKYADGYYFRHISDEYRKEKLEDVLHASYEDLIQYSYLIDEVMHNGGVCLIGGEHQLKDFECDEIIHL